MIIAGLLHNKIKEVEDKVPLIGLAYVYKNYNQVQYVLRSLLLCI